MGVRLYNPNTGLFTSTDPVPGGNTTAYAYPQDPINKYDLDGKAWGWLKKIAKVAKVVAKVAEVASFIPGPIGMIASVVAVVGFAASGDFKSAAFAALGAIPGAKLAQLALKSGGRIGKLARAAVNVQAKSRGIGVNGRFTNGKFGQWCNRGRWRVGWSKGEGNKANWRVGLPHNWHLRWPKRNSAGHVHLWDHTGSVRYK